MIKDQDRNEGLKSVADPLASKVQGPKKAEKSKSSGQMGQEEMGVKAQKKEQAGGLAQRSASGKVMKAEADKAGASAAQKADSGGVKSSLKKPDVGKKKPEDPKKASAAAEKLRESKAAKRQKEKAVVAKPKAKITVKPAAKSAVKLAPKAGGKAATVEAKKKQSAKTTVAKAQKTKQTSQPKAGKKSASGGASGYGGTPRSIGGGGGGRGAINVPSIGGGGPSVSPKGAGGGANAIDRFANSGLSYQIEHQSALGGEASVDLKKTATEIETKLPGEAGGQVADSAKTAQAVQEGAATKSKNAASKESNFDANANIKTDTKDAAMASSAKSVLEGAGEDIPSKPNVDVDYSVVESGEKEEAIKYSSAQSEGQAKVSTLEKKMPKRGFDDIKAPKAEVESDDMSLDSGQSAALSDVAGLSSEGKGLLDISDLVQQTTSGMQGVKASVQEAENQSKSDTDAKIAEHETAVKAEMQKAEADETQAIEQKQSELDAQVSAESQRFDAELTSYDAEQKSLISSSKSELDKHRAAAQSKIDSEHASSVKKKKEKEKEGKDKEKKEKSLLQKIGDKAKQVVSAVVNWLKEALRAIISLLKRVISAVLDTFVKLVGLVNKNLAAKLKKAFDKFKVFINKLAEALIKLVDKALDWIEQKVNQIIDAVVSAINALVDLLKAAIKQLLSALKAVYANAMSKISAILNALKDPLKAIFMAACKLAGVDPGIFSSAMGSLREIIKNPGRFFSTLGKGFVQGFRNFSKNIAANVKKIFSNLFNMWIGSAGISMPGAFSVPSLIKLGLEIIGVNVNGILAKLGINDVNDLSNIDKEAPLGRFVSELKSGGIGAVVKHIKGNLAGLAKEIMNEAIKSIVQRAASAAIGKLAMLATPVGGIVAALKAVWDLIQFVRSNLATIGGLVTAVTSFLGEAAAGNSGGVSAAVEGALCQAIPLAVDLLLRLAGINIGGAIKGILNKIRSKVKAALDAVINKFKGASGKTRAGKAYGKAKAKVGDAKAKVSASAKKADGKVNGKINKTLDKFNNTKTGKKVAGINAKAQKFADKTNAYTKDKQEKQAKKKDNRLVDPSAMVGVLKGEKDGNLGVNLNNSKAVQAADKKKKESTT